MRSGVSRVTARWFTRAAGPWSHMPVQEVKCTLALPSSRVSPSFTPSRSQRRRAKARLPAIWSVMLSLRWKTYSPW